jgi:predicted phosphodiesterase
MDDESIFSRRDFLRLAGLGSVVFASGLSGCASPGGTAVPDFHFVQLSDVHWGYNNPKVNPDHRDTLRKAVAAVNSLEQQPDFVVFTGDLTQSTDNPTIRRQRLREFRDQAAALQCKQVYYFAGEHDASLDRGDAYLEVFGGALYYTFDHKGMHFIVLDNTSDPAPILGDKQLTWLKSHLAQRDRDAPITVLTHRPLFSLYPQWDWDTRDGAKAIELLMPFANVTVLYGHIHHEHHFRTGHIAHHAAMSPMFPLSPVGSVPQKTQLPWDAAHPYKGLGYRQASIAGQSRSYRLHEHAMPRQS